MLSNALETSSFFGLCLLLGVLALLGLAILKLRRNAILRPTLHELRREARAELQERAAQAQLQQELTVHLQRLIERLPQEVDARIDRLEKLIGVADERLQALRQGSDVTRQAIDPPINPRMAAGSLNQPGPGSRLDDLRAQVRVLAEKGIGAGTIATRLGVSVGEVEVLLGLQRLTM